MTISVGVPVTGNFTRNGEFAVSSMSTASQTNCPAYRASELSVNTNARMSRHECHHSAQASTKIGTFFFFAWASAFA